MTERRVNISLRLDESIAKYNRSMGIGYQARINRMLATYAQIRIGKVNELDEFVRGCKPVDYVY